MNGFLWQTVLRCCIILVLLVTSPWVIAKNAEQSQWLQNLSESALENEPGNGDDAPEIAVSGTTVHVMWTAQTPEKKILYYRRSTDLGQTWQPKIPLMESKEGILMNPGNRKLAVAGNTVHVFQNHYRGSWYGVITYFRSTDNGASFEPGKDVVTAAQAHHLYDIYAHAEQAKVYLAYANVRNWEVKDSINLLVSQNNGDSFASYPVADFDKDKGDQHPRLFDMQVHGDRVALVYGDSYSYYGLRWHRLFTSVSQDGGKQFSSKPIDIPSDENNNPKSYSSTSNYAPNIAFAGDNVYIVFHAIDDQGKDAVFFRRSIDHGQTFDPAIKLSRELSNRTIECCHETLAAHGDKVYVIFLDKQGKLYFKRSLNGGVSFEAVKELTAAGNANYGGMAVAGTWWPQIRLDHNDETGSTIHIVGNHLFHVYSKDAGANFSSPLTLYPPLGTSSNLERVKVAIDDEGALHFVSLGHITWYRTGVFGDVDIFYRRFHPVVTPSATTTTQQALYLQHHEVLKDGSGVERWDTMAIASSEALTFKNAFTAEAWVKVERQENADGYFLYKTDPGKGGAWGSILLGQWRNGHLDARITTDNDGYVVISNKPVTNNRWTHVAISFDAALPENNLRLYIDGELVGQTTTKGALATGRGPYLVGGGSQQGGAYRSVTLDELRLWNRARTQEEIRTTMQYTLSKQAGLVAYYPFDEPFNAFGTVRDVSGNGHTGVLLRKEQLTEGYPIAQKGLKLVAPRSLIGVQHSAILSAQFLSEEQGDLYVAAMIAGRPEIYFLDESGGFHPNRPLPFRRNGQFSGSLPIFTIPGAVIGSGRYRLYAVVTDTGANVFDVSRWHGSLAQFLFIAHEPIADSNGDGWADRDNDRDGFLDDDRDFSGYVD